MDFRGEVGTRRIIEKAWEMNKKVAIPKTVGKTMDFIIFLPSGKPIRGDSAFWSRMKDDLPPVRKG